MRATLKFILWVVTLLLIAQAIQTMHRLEARAGECERTHHIEKRKVLT